MFPNLHAVDIFINANKKPDFSDTKLIAIQHLLASNASLFKKLNALGMPYSQMYLLGKIYSSNERVADSLLKKGVFVHPASLELNKFSLKTDYRLELRKTAKNLLSMAGAVPSSKLLIIDDGGVLIQLVNQRHKEFESVVAVEQTRSGVDLLRESNGLKIPVVNVAESAAKLTYESPFIAESIIREIETRLKRLPNAPSLKDSEVLVVGFGAVGFEVAKQLRSKCRDVTVFDSAINKLRRAKKQAFNHGKLEILLKSSDIIIGCVGRNWLPRTLLNSAKSGVVLASGSSSNTEFLGVKLGQKKINPKKDFHNISLRKTHSDYSFSTSKGSGWILNAGFPVNFDGSADPIPAKIVQLTRGLMLAGIFQAMNSFNSRPGLIELESQSQKQMIEIMKLKPKDISI